MRSLILSILFILSSAISLFGQTNMFTHKQLTTEIFLGDYDPSEFVASEIIDNPREIVENLNNEVSPDSLLSYLSHLQQFETRNTGSDTISDTRGIGAARRWIYQKLQEFSSIREDRLIVDYFEFDRTVCSMSKHKNVLATLPGNNPEAGIIIIEAHMDSRCESTCDVDCLAQGMEDNASGTALVIELARIMSKYTFDKSILFMLTTGEEQGLVGADAMAKFMKQNDVNVKAVLNNDVIGGVICGRTSSPPSCPGFNHVDSTSVRVFSATVCKPLARYAKIQFDDELKNILPVDMEIRLMAAEDRSGRGGDHIPFREQGYQSIRFTSANEHGDAGINPNYTDRQHSTRDILGVDTNSDSILDSFFVDFNYLGRNTVINGMLATMISSSPITPDFDISQNGFAIDVDIDDPNDYLHYKVGVRTNSQNLDTIYEFTDSKEFNFPITEDDFFVFVSVMSVDDNGIESCFSSEKRIIISSTSNPEIEQKNIQLNQNIPNPFDESTTLSWYVNNPIQYNNAFIVVRSVDGRIVSKEEVVLTQGQHEWIFNHSGVNYGLYQYYIEVDGRIADVKTMVFAN